MYSISKIHRSLRLCRLGNTVINNELSLTLRNVCKTNQVLDIAKESDADTFGSLNQNRHTSKSKKKSKNSLYINKQDKNYDIQEYHQVNIRNNWHENRALEKWSEFREADYQKILKQSRNPLEDDEDDDFNYLLGKTNKNVEKDSEEHLELNRIEHQVTVPPEGNINQFGTLGVIKYDHETYEDDEGDVREEKFQEGSTGRKHTPEFYAQNIKKLCKEKNLSEALKILEEDMVNDGVKPNEYCYQLLINACGRVGYTQKAFKLFNQMKKHGLKPHHVCYTGLFDACANSPWKTNDGLRRATKLKQQLDEAGYPYNEIISHAMIKAFGRCGDVQRAFEIVDKMLASGLIITTRTVNTLLQACISDKEAGFRHALLAWRKMRELKLKPDIFTYNLLIHCTKECKGGDMALSSKLLELPLPNGKIKKKNRKKETVILIGDSDLERTKSDFLDVNNEEKYINNKTDCKLSDQSKTSENIEDASSSVEFLNPKFKPVQMSNSEFKINSERLVPQLLAQYPKAGSVVALTSLEEPQHRLALLGGSLGLLEQMKKDKITPNLKTYTQLIDSLSPSNEAEMVLLNSMKYFGLSPDTQFCNMLIRKRSFRFDKKGAEAILDLMSEHKLNPDLITFGCLALCCYDAHSSRELLQSMDATGCIPNATIMTSLLRNSLKNKNYFFAVDLLLEMQQRKVNPESVIVQHLEKARREARKALLELEGTSKLRKLDIIEKKTRDGARLFLMEWKNYLSSSSTSDLHDHPWAQYKRTKPDNIQI